MSVGNIHWDKLSGIKPSLDLFNNIIWQISWWYIKLCLIWSYRIVKWRACNGNWVFLISCKTAVWNSENIAWLWSKNSLKSVWSTFHAWCWVLCLWTRCSALSCYRLVIIWRRLNCDLASIEREKCMRCKTQC